MFGKSKPQFTIVVPTLNEEKYLPNLLGDLSSQTLKDFELIIVDGNSEDKTVKLAKGFQRRLKNLKIISTPKRNVSYQRNMGSQKARADWIIFMDADNRLPEYFLEGVSYKIKLTRPELFTCWVKVEGKLKSDEGIARALNIGAELAKAASTPGAVGAMIGITKDGFTKVGGFDEKMGFAEDWDLVKRCFAKGLSFKIFRDPKYTYSLRQLERGGRLRSLRRLANVYLKYLSGVSIDQKKEYPMGGKYTKSEINFFDKLKENLRRLSKKPKFLRQIRSLLESLDNGY